MLDRIKISYMNLVNENIVTGCIIATYMKTGDYQLAYKYYRMVADNRKLMHELAHQYKELVKKRA